jgi:Transglutaminase-like superfamily
MRMEVTMRPLAVLTLIGILGLALMTPGVPSVRERDSASDPVADAAAHIVGEVTYIERRVLTATKVLPRAHLLALSTMNYVVGRVTAPAYGYRRDVSGEMLPDGGTTEIVARRSLSMQAGICGHATHTMLAILSRLGVRSRPVHLYYSTPGTPRNSHAGVEVHYHDAWHYFDPTWGSLYRHPEAAPAELLSAHAIALLPKQSRARARRDHETLLWRQVVAMSSTDPADTGYAAFDAADLRLVIDDVLVYQRSAARTGTSSGAPRRRLRRLTSVLAA